jgi:hypothetical protein
MTTPPAAQRDHARAQHFQIRCAGDHSVAILMCPGLVVSPHLVSGGGLVTVDADDLAGDEGRLLIGHEEDRVGDLPSVQFGSIN